MVEAGTTIESAAGGSLLEREEGHDLFEETSIQAASDALYLQKYASIHTYTIIYIRIKISYMDYKIFCIDIKFLSCTSS